MNDLTEKWKAGELTQWRFYYVLYSGGIEPLLLNGENNFKNHSKIVNPLIKEVLAPVPSFKELQALKEENARLKNFLKECMDMFVKMYSTNTVNSVFLDLYENIKTKIEEALK